MLDVVWLVEVGEGGEEDSETVNGPTVNQAYRSGWIAEMLQDFQRLVHFTVEREQHVHGLDGCIGLPDE
jgi:hypothetical protein